MPDTKLEQKIAAAALRLASMRRWETIMLPQIAKTAKVPLTKVQKIFADRDRVLPAIVALIDDKTSKAIGKPLTRGTPRDRLFEVMMARVDALQESRRGILAIMTAVRRSPGLACLLFPAHKKAIKRMLSLAGIAVSQVQQPLVIGGLLAVHAATLCRWQSDNTVDLSKTMAALDRSLRIAEKFAEILLRPI
jgi:ubiquinone biosynthesis protein COQ9